MKNKFILIIILIIFTGCHSIPYRLSSSSYDECGAYPSVRADINYLDVKGVVEAEPLLTGAESIIFILALFDLPLALAIDTICLPYDIFRGCRKKDNTEKSTTTEIPHN